MKQFRTPQPGDRAIRAEDIRAIADEVIRLGKFEATGADVEWESGANGQRLSLRSRPPAFWAELLDEPSADGWYSWREVERSFLGVFTELQYGRTWEDGLSPARDANGATGLPTLASTGAAGLYVWLELGYGLPVTGGVVQEWIFRHGGGGGGAGGFWARIDSMDCAAGSFGIVEIIPQSVGTWIDKAGGITSSLAYHAQKGMGPFASGGPLVAVGTRVWVTRGFNDGAGTQEYVFDCPAGFTGLETVMTDWQCVDGVGTKTIMYRESWNGQQTRAMTLNPPTGSVCG